GASTLAAHHVLDVVFKRILVIPQWDQFIAAGAGEGPKAGSHVAGNFPGPVKITGTGRDPDDRSMERVTDLLCQLFGELRVVDEERLVVRVQDCPQDAVPPRLMDGLKDDLEQTEFTFLQLGQ